MDRRSTILVVDDEELNRSLLRALLSASFDVLEASSGVAALEILGRAPVDLVLLDVMMPELDGFATCKLIKAQPRDSLLPVILVTALGEQEDRNRGLESGADDFLRKPVDRRELLLRVRSFLRLRGQEQIIRGQVEELKRLQTFKDDMVSLLVHDLRNPLSGLLSNLEPMLETAREKQQLDDLRRALRAGEGLRSVLDETLQVRLLEEKAISAQRAPAILADVLAAAVDSIQPVAKRRGIALSSLLEGEIGAELDEKLVRRSVENLLSNAVKYSSKGGSISVTARNHGGFVEIDVADSGPGIPDALKGVLFERFGSLEAHRGRERRGVGLGLYLVKLVAEAHDGDVSVHDVPGGGALFRLRLHGAGVRAR